MTLKGLSRFYVHIYAYNNKIKDIESLRESRGHIGGAEERKSDIYLNRVVMYEVLKKIKN